jgi:hypothetical protein
MHFIIKWKFEKYIDMEISQEIDTLYYPVLYHGEQCHLFFCCIISIYHCFLRAAASLMANDLLLHVILYNVNLNVP